MAQKTYLAKKHGKLPEISSLEIVICIELIPFTTPINNKIPTSDAKIAIRLLQMRSHMKQNQRKYPHYFHALFSQSKNGSQQQAFLKNE